MTASRQASGCPGRVVGIDYGTRRIGIALSNPERTIASPYESYVRRGQQADLERFRRLVAEEGVTLLVVGLPVHLDGRESSMATQARAFGQWLADQLGLPVVFFDERFSTRAAEQSLWEAGLTHKARKHRRDMVAAQMMLAAFLESGAKGSAPPRPLDG